MTRDKRVDLQKRQTTRNVFSCHVIGPQGAGKSSFLKGFLGQNLEKQFFIKENLRQDPKSDKKSRANHMVPTENNLIRAYTSTVNYSVNSVEIYGQEKYLIIREVDIFTLTDKLAEPELMCDVVCLTYDLSNPHSFEYIARIYLKHFYDCRLPIQVLGMKADEAIVVQEYFMQPEDFCAKYKLAKPQIFTVASSDGTVPSEIYVKLATMAAYPTLRRLVHVLALKPTSTWVASRLNALQRVMPESATIVRASIGLATLAIAGFFVLRFIRPNSR